MRFLELLRGYTGVTRSGVSHNIAGAFTVDLHLLIGIGGRLIDVSWIGYAEIKNAHLALFLLLEP